MRKRHICGMCGKSRPAMAFEWTKNIKHANCTQCLQKKERVEMERDRQRLRLAASQERQNNVTVEKTSKRLRRSMMRNGWLTDRVQPLNVQIDELVKKLERAKRRGNTRQVNRIYRQIEALQRQAQKRPEPSVDPSSGLGWAWKP